MGIASYHDRTNLQMASWASLILASVSGSTFRQRLGHAVRETVVEEVHCDCLEHAGRRRDLIEDVDAVLLFVDHALEATGLTLDSIESSLNGCLLVDVPGLSGRTWSLNVLSASGSMTARGITSDTPRASLLHVTIVAKTLTRLVSVS